MVKNLTYIKFQTLESYIKQLKIRFLNDQEFPNNDIAVKFPNDFDLGKHLRKEQ